MLLISRTWDHRACEPQTQQYPKLRLLVEQTHSKVKGRWTKVTPGQKTTASVPQQHIVLMICEKHSVASEGFL